MGKFIDAVQGGDHRAALEAMRDKLAAKIDGPQCPACGAGQLEASDLAALTLRLAKILDELAGLPPAKNATLTPLAAIRERRASQRPGVEAAAADTGVLGTKSGPRRQGGRRPRVNRGG